MSRSSRRESEHYLFLDIDLGAEANLAVVREARQNALTFFGAANTSSRPEHIRIGVFRKILSHQKITNPSARKDYADWLKKPIDEIIQIGRSRSFLRDDQIELLARINDPALIVVSAFEHIRQTDYPDLSKEASLPITVGRMRLEQPDKLGQIYNTYDEFLASLHGPAMSRLGNTAIAGN